MNKKMIQRMLAAALIVVLFTVSLGSSALTIPVYAAADAEDALETEVEAANPAEDAAEPEAEATDPEAAVDMEDAADFETEAADPDADIAADPDTAAESEAEAVDPDAGTALETEASSDVADASADDPLTESGAETAAAAVGEGKYVSDVFIAYGKSVEDAEKYLTDNGWEPLPGTNNFNAGKNSYWDDSVAAAMGIRRTDDPEKAVTDMAVMNMKGGYSFSDYEDIVDEKRTEIDEFIRSFLPAIEEYRANAKGEGSELGKKRAELARMLLNKFYDGKPGDTYAANDTGLPIGDLLLEPLRQEEGGENGGDLQQIILESSAEVVQALETCIVLAADTSENTWLDRVAVISKDSNLGSNIGLYVPEAAGQDIPASAILQFLEQEFGDSSRKLCRQWQDIHDKMLWYEEFNNEHDLWQYDDESDEDYAERYTAIIQELENESEGYGDELTTYSDYGILYWGLYDVDFPGNWGRTLGDFYNPAKITPYISQTYTYYPMAMALSKGQRRALDLVSLYSLLMIGFTNEKGIEDTFPDVEEMLGDAEAISVYSGINRGIFRNGVALTSAALMDKDRGYDPYGDIFELSNAYNTLCYVAAVLSVGTLAAGITTWAGASKIANVGKNAPQAVGHLIQDKTGRIVRDINGNMSLADMQKKLTFYEGEINTINAKLKGLGETDELVEALNPTKNLYNENIDVLKIEIGECENANATNLRAEVDDATGRFSKAGKILTCIGGALMIIAACVKGYQVYRYYQKDFTPIPRMIVDEADIITYTENKDGTTTKKIDFDQFVYYEAARCNRDKKHKISDWQDGVSDYAKWGCGDVADLNVDQGQEWLALYTVRSPKKGYPILADSLIMQYGSDKQPAGTTKALHFFTYTHAADIGDTAYSYNNDKHGIYFFWDEDQSAYDVPAATASTFSSGYLALSGFGGLLLGILGTTLVLYPRRKKMQGEV